MVKTVLIGLDGVPWNYLNKAIERGYCPTIKWLINKGISGKLRSTIPPISPVAWSSFITGKLPQNHGIFDWQVPENGRLRPVNANDRHGTPFWKYLNSNGLRVGIIGIPLTFPVEPIDGFMISGFDSIWDSEHCCWPKELKAILNKKFGNKVDLIFSSRNDFPSEWQLLEYHMEKDKLDTEAAIYLAQLYDIDTLIINYMTVDHLNHSAKDEEAILKGFISFDKNIQKILEKYSNSQILIMSDHGSYRNKGGFLICEVLKQAGLLEFNRKNIDKKHHMELLVRFLQGSLKLSGLKEKILRRICYYILNCLPMKIRNIIWQKVYEYDERIFHIYWNLDKTKSLVELSTGFKAGVAEIYFKREQAIKLGKDNNYLEKTLKERLSKVKTPEGKNYFLEIYNGKDFFNGPYAHLAPDIIAIADTEKPDYGICLNYPMGGNSKVDGLFAFDADLYAYLMKGTHCQDGIYIFKGEEFKNNQNGPLMNIVNIPLTLLCLKGIPIPEDFDGKIYPELFNESFLSNLKIRCQKSISDNNKRKEMSEEEEKEIAKKLKQLGYI